MASGELVNTNDTILEGNASIPEWVPCPGCPFAGEVIEFSPYGTALTSDPAESEGEIVVTYAEHDGAFRSGEVTVYLSGDSYGSGDDGAAAERATHALRECADREVARPIQGYRARIAGVGIIPVNACAAFSKVNGNGVVVRKPGILKVKNA